MNDWFPKKPRKVAAQGDAIGMPLSAVFPFVDEDSREPINLLLMGDGPLAISKKGFNGILQSRYGKPTPIEASITSIKDEKAKIYGTVLVFRDVTQQREAIQEIKRQANRAEALVEVASQLNSQFELQTVLNSICEISYRTIKAAGAVVFLQNSHQETFRLMAAISNDLALKTYHEGQFEIPRGLIQG